MLEGVKKLLRVGIIGSKGLMGKRRIKYLRNNSNYEIVSKCDIKGDQYTDYKEMINNEELDAVFICVPHTLTVPMAKYCLSKGLHVFAEKPPGISLDECESLIQFIGDRKIMFGFNHRYFSTIKHLKEVIDSNRLGDIRWIRGIYGRTSISGDQAGWRGNKKLGGRGILISQGIHLVDLIRYITKSEFDSVKSYTNNYTDNWYEDNVMAIMKSTSNNIVASIHSSCVINRYQFNLIVGFEKGYVEVDGLSMSRNHRFGFPDSITICYVDNKKYIDYPKKEIFYYEDNDSWKRELEKFNDVIMNDLKEYSNSLDDAIKTMEVIEYIYENANDY